MYCRNCGSEMKPDEKVCTHCGVQAGVGNRFCPNCGQSVDPNAILCVHCGIQFKAPAERKSKVVAGLLAIFLGTFGIHNFYLNYTGRAVVQASISTACILLSCCTFGLSLLGMGAIGIWALVEGIMILCGSIDRDGNGNLLRE